MENIWSENKRINLIINILLFLLAINFMHYAQILVPIICLILFIDNKYKFKVNNKKIFIVLCLFGVSFLYFDRNESYFSFIGLFIPMAYYIGSNIIEPNENKIKYLIYIFTYGMTMHIVLNFACDFIIRGIECFSKNSHLDIWTLSNFPTTQTATNYMLIIGVMFYILVFEKNKKIKMSFIILSIISFIYLLALGRRTPFLLLIIVLFFSTIYYFTISKKINYKKILIIIIILIPFVVFTIWSFYAHKENIFYAKPELLKLSILRKIYSDGLDLGRIDILINTIKLAPSHLFGGREITTIIGYGPHELWLDIFDASGIIPYVLFVTYSINCLVNIVKVFINNRLTNQSKILFFGVFLSITIQFFLEPILSGSSTILLCCVILFSCFESLNSN